jgi:hypothetical protein
MFFHLPSELICFILLYFSCLIVDEVVQFVFFSFSLVLYVAML